MKKLLLSLLFVSIVLFANAYDFMIDGLCYNKNDDGTSVSVTYEYNYHPSYSNLSGDIVIPENVTYDGTTYSVTSIDYHAFYDCSGLTSVTIPNSVTSIGNFAFFACINLTSVTIPNSVTSIGSYAFDYCRGLTSIIIPNSVTNIGSFSFAECSSMNSITIPNSVTSIGGSAFEGCACLTSVTWNAKTCNDFNINDNFPFKDCTNIQSFVFGNEVEKIPVNLCYGLTGLTYVIIGNSVTSIGEGAFFGCAGITSVTWNAKSCNDFADNSPFGGSINIQSFSFGNEVKSIPTSLCRGLTGLTSVTIPNSVISIGGSAFKGCTILNSVTVCDSVNTIGGSTFAGCKGLKSIIIPNLVTEIGNYSFYNCSELTSVSIPNKVTSIGNSAFSGCTSLNTAIIGENVTSSGEQAFMNCSLMENIVALRERPIFINSNVFEGVPKASCDLHVRQGSKIRYENQDVWKDFLIIVEDAEDWADVSGGGSGSGIYGDVNGDGHVNSVDITIIYNILLGTE